MHLSRPIGLDLEPSNWRGGIACVAHPGYYRPSGPSGIFALLAHPKALYRDAVTRLKRGGPPGAWEDNKSSLAFVPPKLRKTYVHGAVWIGWSKELFSMCRELSVRTEDDTARGVMAQWHDESHLNWYFANHQLSLLPQSYSCVEGWWQTRNVSSSIVSVQKGDGYR